MGKLKDNLMMDTTGGKVGKQVVFRNFRGKTIVASRPLIKDRKPSDKQLAVQEKFTLASSYAKSVLKNPDSLAMYTAGIGGKHFTARMVAMGDYLNSPKVVTIDTSFYKGVIGDVISIKATDDFKVTKVLAVILAADGTQLESGAAVQDTNNELQWKYTATVANATPTGTKVQARAYDLPENTGTLEKVV